jgi:hypothetical protein
MPQQRTRQTPRRTIWRTDYTKQIENLGILLCITFLIFIFINYNTVSADNTRNFYLQYHNVDLTFNIQNIVSTLNAAGLYDSNGSLVYIPFEKVTDTGSDYVERPLTKYYIPSMNSIDEAYMNSVKHLNKYFVLGLIDVLVLGLLLGRKL